MYEVCFEGHIQEPGRNPALKLDVDVDATDKMERTGLHHAAINGHLDVVELLLEWDADIDAIDEEFSSPLHLAAMIGEADVVQYLLEAGADIDAINNRGWSPLFEAVIQDELGVVKILAEVGADVNIVMNDDGRTPLHAAVQVKNVEMAASNGHATARALARVYSAVERAIATDGEENELRLSAEVLEWAMEDAAMTWDEVLLMRSACVRVRALALALALAIRHRARTPARTHHRP